MKKKAVICIVSSHPARHVQQKHVDREQTMRKWMDNESFTVVSADNIDFKHSFARVSKGTQNSSWHGTSIHYQWTTAPLRASLGPLTWPTGPLTWPTGPLTWPADSLWTHYGLTHLADGPPLRLSTPNINQKRTLPGPARQKKPRTGSEYYTQCRPKKLNPYE